MFSYTIAKEMDSEAFDKACKEIEWMFVNARKIEYPEDIDGDRSRIYYVPATKHTPIGRIEVRNDFWVDAVYVDSTINLDMLFQKDNRDNATNVYKQAFTGGYQAASARLQQTGVKL